MKRIITIAALLLGCAVCGAQDSVEALQEKYNRLVRTLGYDGVGVETTLERWEAVSPLDGNMLEGWFNFWITKARSTEALPLDRQTYLGQKPLVSLKDSTGRIVNYFQVTNYDDEYFGKAASAIERAIAAHPDNLGYRLERIDALMAYEEGTPELALDALLKLIQEDQKGTVRWIYGGDTLQRSDFADLMQQYCYFLFQADEPGTLDAFYTISQKLFKSYPDKLDFLCNQVQTAKKLQDLVPEGTENVVVISCGLGIQTVADMVDVPVVAASNSLNYTGHHGMALTQKTCGACAQCYLNVTGGICPITACSKSLLNGQCGGAKNGMCEVDPTMECGWERIVQRLKAQGRLDILKCPTQMHDWNTDEATKETKEN